MYVYRCMYSITWLRLSISCPATIPLPCPNVGVEQRNYHSRKHAFGPQKCDQHWSQKQDRASCSRHWRLQIWDPNSGTKKASVAGCKLTLLGPRLARRDSNLKFLRLTFPFVFLKLLARAPTHTVYTYDTYICTYTYINRL